jgi:hypothetical protein
LAIQFLQWRIYIARHELSVWMQTFAT